jgi:hypothetical protein
MLHAAQVMRTIVISFRDSSGCHISFIDGRISFTEAVQGTCVRSSQITFLHLRVAQQPKIACRRVSILWLNSDTVLAGNIAQDFAKLGVTGHRLKVEYWISRATAERALTRISRESRRLGWHYGVKRSGRCSTPACRTLTCLPTPPEFE